MGSKVNPSLCSQNKNHGPQFPAALEFVSMAVGIKQMEQRVQRISGLGQSATGFLTYM